MAGAGFGWKDGSTGTVHTERAEDLVSIQWLRSLRGQGFQLRCQLRSGKVAVFEGFSQDAAPALTEFFKAHYNLPLSLDEASGKGWNWGNVEINKENDRTGSINYSVAGRLAFQVPLKQVTNALVASKNELALEFSNGLVENVDDKDDQITEIRFYIPDEKDSDEEDENEESTGEEEKIDVTGSRKAEELMDYEELDTSVLKPSSASATTGNAQNVASQLLQEIKSLSDFSKISGDVIAALPEIACVVPRGRYRIDMFDSFLRLHGKSYDFKIDYTSVQKLFLLPKTDDAHILLVLALDPPLKQGLTRYPHLIMQFPKEERIEEFELKSLTPADLSGIYGGKLQAKYQDVSTFELVSVLFRGLAGQKIVVPGAFKSVISGHPAIKCTIKANEGALYPLEKNFMFIPKPTLLIPHSDIAQCVFSRVGGPTSSFGGNPRSFDFKISVRGTGTEHLFSNIAKEELDTLVEYLRSKQIPFITEEEGRVRPTKKAVESDSDDGDVKMLGDEDESTDEDYNDDDDDDSDEDGDVDDSDDGSDEDDDDDEEDEDEDEDEDEE